MQYTAAAFTVRQVQAAAAARWRNTTRLADYQRRCRCMGERPSLPLSAMLLIHTYFLLLARALSKMLLLYCACCRPRQRALWKFNQQPAAVLWPLYSWCVQTIIVTVESLVSLHRLCDDVRLHYSFTVPRCVISFELTRLIFDVLRPPGQVPRMARLLAATVHCSVR